MRRTKSCKNVTTMQQRNTAMNAEGLHRLLLLVPQACLGDCTSGMTSCIVSAEAFTSGSSQLSQDQCAQASPKRAWPVNDAAHDLNADTAKRSYPM